MTRVSHFKQLGAGDDVFPYSPEYFLLFLHQISPSTVAHARLRTRPSSCDRCASRRILGFREAWRITYMDSCEDASAQARNHPPRPPHETYPPLKRNLKMRVSSMAGASSASCEPWCNPDDPSSHKQPPGVNTQPYKKAFVQADEGRGREERTTRGGRGRRASRMPSARADGWRQETKAPTTRHPPLLGTTETTNSGAGSQLKPAPSRVKPRVPPAVVPRSAGSSMSLTGGKFIGRPRCRLRV